MNAWQPRVRKVFTLLAMSIAGGGCGTRGLTGGAPVIPLPPVAQNPSPMAEHTRRHDRVPPGQPAGMMFTIDSVLPKSVQVFIPERSGVNPAAPDERTLLVHFFGAAYVAMHAVSVSRGRYVLAIINLGAGSSAYEKPMSDSTVWPTLLRRIREEITARTNGRLRVGRVVVSAFSAGYGGVRALLRDERVAAGIDGVILLDGLHTGYIPERTAVSEGGALDTTNLVPFLRYARRAMEGRAQLLITHSEIFPGTFASTTETTDWLIGSLGLTRSPVLAWGPGGMQQISEVRRGGLTILGFAGNTGPDHVDHLHGLGEFLRRLERPVP